MVRPKARSSEPDSTAMLVRPGVRREDLQRLPLEQQNQHDDECNEGVGLGRPGNRPAVTSRAVDLPVALSCRLRSVLELLTPTSPANRRAGSRKSLKRGRDHGGPCSSQNSAAARR